VKVNIQHIEGSKAAKSIRDTSYRSTSTLVRDNFDDKQLCIH